MSGGGLEVITYVREWMGCPPGCPVVFSWLSWMSESSRVAFPDVRQWLGFPH